MSTASTEKPSDLPHCLLLLPLTAALKQEEVRSSESSSSVFVSNLEQQKHFFVFNINTTSVIVSYNMNAGCSRLKPPPEHCIHPWHTFKNRSEIFEPSTCSISWSTSSALRRTLPLLSVPVAPLDCLAWNASFCRPRLDTSGYCIRPRLVQFIFLDEILESISQHWPAEASTPFTVPWTSVSSSA